MDAKTLPPVVAHEFAADRLVRHVAEPIDLWAHLCQSRRVWVRPDGFDRFGEIINIGPPGRFHSFAKRLQCSAAAAEALLNRSGIPAVWLRKACCCHWHICEEWL
jgi:hypothetical protein